MQVIFILILDASKIFIGVTKNRTMSHLTHTVEKGVDILKITKEQWMRPYHYLLESGSIIQQQLYNAGKDTMSHEPHISLMYTKQSKDSANNLQIYLVDE